MTDGLMDCQMDVYLQRNIQKGGSIGRWMETQKAKQIGKKDRLADRQRSRWTDGQTKRYYNREINRQTVIQIGKELGGLMDGWMDGRMDRQTERRICPSRLPIMLGSSLANNLPDVQAYLLKQSTTIPVEQMSCCSPCLQYAGLNLFSFFHALPTRSWTSQTLS